MNLLISRKAWNYTRQEEETLINLGINVIPMITDSDAIPCSLQDIDGVICSGLFRFHPIEGFTNLKYVQINSTGFDNQPTDYMNEHGIEFHNARDVFAVPISESVLAAVLMFYRDMRVYEKQKKEHTWKRTGTSLELCGKTVCIIGCGGIGRECAKKFRAFGCRVVGVNRTLRYDENIEEIYPYSNIPIAAIYVLALPLNNETRGLIGKEFFKSMPDNAIFCNVGRGAVTDEEALVEELKTGRIKAYLEVFGKEPLPDDSPLWDMDNVIITPHSTSDGDGVAKRLSDCIISNLTKYLS